MVTCQHISAMPLHAGCKQHQAHQLWAMWLQMLSYQDLMQQLEISSLRELEDLLITECFYASIISGKLDQQAACLHVHAALGRDVRPDQLGDIKAALQKWCVAGSVCLANVARWWLAEWTCLTDLQQLIPLHESIYILATGTCAAYPLTCTCMAKLHPTKSAEKACSQLLHTRANRSAFHLANNCIVQLVRSGQGCVLMAGKRTWLSIAPAGLQNGSLYS